MDPDEDIEIGRSEDIPGPATMEEMRKKRLAYFNAADSKKAVNEWELENPLSTTTTEKISKHNPTEYFNDTKAVNDDQTFGSTSQKQTTSHLLIERNPLSLPRSIMDSTVANTSSVTAVDSNLDAKHNIENPKLSKQEPQHSTGRLDYMDKDPKPLRPKREKLFQKSIDSDMSHFQLTESQDIEGLSIFNSHPDLGDLGLLTHRPESESSSRTIQGELFIPASHGVGKTTKQIFSERVEDEIRSALGDEKMEKLMLKVNADIGQLHQQSRSPRRRQRMEESRAIRREQNGTGLSRSSSVDSFSPFNSAERPLNSYRSRAGSQSPHRHPVPQNFQEGEQRDIPALIRNYDQITVPRNTKNSFSSEEIYRKAYGGFQESAPNPEKHSNRRWSNADYATQGEGRVYPVSSRGRKASAENLANAPAPPPHFQNYPNTFTLPVTSMPPPHFDSQVHNNQPPNPQSSFSRGQTGTVPVFMPSAYPHPHSYFPEASGNAPLHYNPYASQSPSCSPSQMPSSNPFFCPNPPFSPHFGGGRFPENVPFHLPPPSTLPHQPLKHGQPQGPFEQAAGRRNSLSLHGHPGYGDEIAENVPVSASLKMPHPPANPPAISRYEDGSSAKARHGKEARQLPAHSEQASSKENEKNYNSYNLQRYFSSINLSPEDADHSVVRSAPQSSRSVDGDFDQSNNDDNMSAFTNASEFTSVTKAGGITNRLGDLGVNLDHLKHLWVVDSKGEADSKNEDHSKQIRRCPECGTANKTYMMWCIECSESLIGVEPSMPRGKKNSKQKTHTAESGPSSQEAGRRRTVEQDEKPQSSHTGDSDLEDSSYQRKDSPESGKGISLSSSPVRYRGDQEELAEPKDSGRASIGDPKDGVSLAVQEARESASDLEGFDENEEVEYVYEDVEADISEQISDPILRDFIISYRNRQELNLDSILNSYVVQDNSKAANITKKAGGSEYSSEFSTYNGEESRDKGMLSDKQTFSNQNGVQRPDESEQYRQDYVNNSNFSSTKGNFNNSIMSHQDNGAPTGGSFSESILENSQPSANAEKPKKTKKKKKHKPNIMDIEIFGYEETRQSRNSSRCENIVPILNLVRSSEEEESSSEEDDSDEQNSSIVYGEENLSRNVMVTKSDPPQPHKTGVPRYQANNAKQNPPSREVVKKPFMSTSQASSSFSSPTKQPGNVNQGTGPQVKLKGNNPVPANYQRHWARSSTAWSSYKPRELSTRSSVPGPLQQDTAKGSRPSSARLPQRRANPSDESNVRSSTNMHNRQRPASAEYSRRKPVSNLNQPFRPSSASNNAGQRVTASVTKSYSSSSVSVSSHTSSSAHPRGVTESSNDFRRNGAGTTSLSQPSLPSEGGTAISETTNSPESAKENDSPRLLCSELHRLPHEEEEDGPSDKMHAIAKTAYDRFHEMTPRIHDGGLSLWQCLPDEIWLYILSLLSQADLARLMMVSRGFHRLANDATLWRYITVRPRYSITDEALGSIASHRPISLAMVKCQGPDLSLQALDMFFRDTQERLKELNICGCSQGSLVGSTVLDTASKYCHNLTHVDVSFCNIKDNSFFAMVSCVNKLESLCVNGFQSMSDSALMTLLKKHGKSLHTLELYACFSLTASVLRKLGDYCVKLRRLCLGGCNKLTDSTMITLSTCLPKIEELDLRGCKNLRNDCIRKIVRNCPRISMLVLANCQQISDAALVEMGTYLKDTLRVVDVCGCNLVGDQGIISLAKNCNQLVSLDISSSKCTSSSVNHLASSGCSRWLKTIKLSFLTGLSEVSILNLIRQCPRLRLIHIFGCPSLKNQTKLKAANPRVCIEGDIEMPRLSFQ